MTWLTTQLEFHKKNRRGSKQAISITNTTQSHGFYRATSTPESSRFWLHRKRELSGVYSLYKEGKKPLKCLFIYFLFMNDALGERPMVPMGHTFQKSL